MRSVWLLAAVAVVGLCPGAQAASEAAGPCAVTYAASSSGPGGLVTADFDVSCTSSWVTAVELRTTIQDLSLNRARANCTETFPSSGGSQTCSLPAKKLHSYLVTYHLAALGYLPGCVDNTDCDGSEPYSSVACATSPGVLGFTSRSIVDCTYREVVTATS